MQSRLKIGNRLQDGLAAANQRTRRTEGDGSCWIYAYDALGQVASGRRYWPDGTPVAGQQFDYAHDDIGNRTGTDTGGDSAGGGLRHANYTANRLNQSTRRDVPGFVDILGLANPTAPVTVNGNPASRKGEYFHYPLAIANSSSPQYTSVSVVSTYGATQTSQGGVYLPKTPEAMAYDSDGNLTGDGRFNDTWDGENRVTRFERISGAPTAAQVRVDLDYDSQSRRIQKVVSTNNGSIWIGVSTNRYLYDGWNLVAVVDHANNLVQSFTWGTDLSGSQQGAGGVGGLLSMTVASGTLAGTYFYAHDGNGNVMAAVNAADGSVSARYDYGPFGEPVRASGSLAQANPFQFSTKFNDPETGLLYYGYRYFDPSTGRWPSRDPIQEKGFSSTISNSRLPLTLRFDYRTPNLFNSFVNNPLDIIDPLGLGTWHVTFPDNGTAYARVDVYYVFSKDELRCCPSATVDRYVEGIIGFSLDQDDGGTWDPVNLTAHAEADTPQGVGIRWPYDIFDGEYRLPVQYLFKWVAKCTTGKVFSTYYEYINSTGHVEGSPYTYTTGGIYRPPQGFNSPRHGEWSPHTKQQSSQIIRGFNNAGGI